MKCLTCKDADLQRMKTSQQGVEVDCCPECGGVWLDKGEIFYFTHDAEGLRSRIAGALHEPKKTSRRNPRTGVELVELDLDGLVIDYCLKDGGIWLDPGESRRQVGCGSLVVRLNIDHNFKQTDRASRRAGKKE